MASDLFESSYALLNRANEHIDEAQAIIQAFFDRKPYTKLVDFDRDTRQYVHKIRLTAKLPGRAAAVVKDATSNLRDALDHAVYAAAVGLGVNDPEKTGFPFGNDATHLEGELRAWKFKDVPPEIHPLLMGLQPYPRANGQGNNLLIGLNRIRNPNTHRLLIPIGSASIGTAVRFSGVINGNAQIGYNRWNPATNEIEYMRLSAQSAYQHDIQVAFGVLFGDIEFVRDKPVIGTLREMATEVYTVVRAIEAETSRILTSRC